VQRPEFSVVITCHNQADFISDAVDSAVSQTRDSQAEVVVVDDGSIDGSDAILARSLDRIKLIRLDHNHGANAARNIGARAAKGEYLAFLDGDDVLRPWALGCYHRLAELRKPAMILSRLFFFRGPLPEEKMSTRPPDEIRFIEYDSFLEKDRGARTSASAMVVSRAAFARVGGWTEEIFPADDLDLLIKLAQVGRAVQIVSPTTVLYRVHGRNTIHQVSPVLAMLGTIMRKERAGGYGTRSNHAARAALIGGPVFFWAKRAVQKGMRRQAAELFVDGLPMILASATRRLGAIVKGRHPVETIHLGSRSDASSPRQHQIAI
jgi:glycosyltransferase involved in cell wall biosynthesis